MPERDYPIPLAEAAKRIDVKPDTLRRQIHLGSLAGIKLGRNWFVTRTELDRYERERGGKPIGRPPKDPA